MLPRKTGPAPIFNYRKRPRQAVVADPETQQSSTVTQDKPQPPAGQRISQPPPPPPPLASYASTSRPATSFAARGSRGASSVVGTRPQAPSAAQGQRPPSARTSLPGQPTVQGNWRGMESRPGPKAMAPNRDWKSGATPIRSPAEHASLAGPSGASSRRQQPLYQQPSSSAGAGGGAGSRGGSGGGGNNMSSVQHSAAPPKDRRMPRLHRGQWYRAVGVAKPSWQALQCLSLRPVSLEERQAARAVTSVAIAQLNDICVSVTEM